MSLMVAGVAFVFAFLTIVWKVGQLEHRVERLEGRR